MNKSNRNILLAAIAFVVLTTVLATKGYAAVEPADTVGLNGKIYTMNPKLTSRLK